MTMTIKRVSGGSLTVLTGILLCTASFSPLAAQNLKQRIIQTNSAGDNIHIIDPATNKVVAEITGVEAPHGVTVAPDGSRIYVTSDQYAHCRRRKNLAGDQANSSKREP